MARVLGRVLSVEPAGGILTSAGSWTGRVQYRFFGASHALAVGDSVTFTPDWRQGEPVATSVRAAAGPARGAAVRTENLSNFLTAGTDSET